MAATALCGRRPVPVGGATRDAPWEADCSWGLWKGVVALLNGRIEETVLNRGFRRARGAQL